MIKRFIDCYGYENTDVDTKYDAGHIVLDDGVFIIANQMRGAEETFSIGQPIYDKDHNLMGYLAMGLYTHLNYAADIEIPVEKWMVCKPTKYCSNGKRVFTYWQNKLAEEQRGENR